MTEERILFLCFCGMLFCAGIAKRIDLVFRARSLALETTYKFATACEKSIPYQEFIAVYDSYPSFSGMMLLLSCWNFDSLYPDLMPQIRKILVKYNLLEVEWKVS